MSVFSRMVRAYRKWWGFCPACNSDAPAVDACEECRVGFRFQKHGDGCECAFCVPTIVEDGVEMPRS